MCTQFFFESINSKAVFIFLTLHWFFYLHKWAGVILFSTFFSNSQPTMTNISWDFVNSIKCLEAQRMSEEVVAPSVYKVYKLGDTYVCKQSTLKMVNILLSNVTWIKPATEQPQVLSTTWTMEYMDPWDNWNFVPTSCSMLVWIIGSSTKTTKFFTFHRSSPYEKNKTKYPLI